MTGAVTGTATGCERRDPENCDCCAERAGHLARGRRLEIFTIAWNALEALASIVVGVLAGSVSLVGFGVDSAIESSSGAVLLWRLADAGEARERLAQRMVAGCFLLLAGYVAWDAGTDLWLRQAPEASLIGIVIAIVSLIVMPVLARAKRRVAGDLGSRAMAADARQTDLCVYLSAILLVGLGANAAFGWWWADPAAALAMLPIILTEARRSWRGEHCC